MNETDPTKQTLSEPRWECALATFARSRAASDFWSSLRRDPRDPLAIAPARALIPASPISFDWRPRFQRFAMDPLAIAPREGGRPSVVDLVDAELQPLEIRHGPTASAPGRTLQETNSTRVTGSL